MNSKDSIRKHIKALRDEVDRQQKERHRAIDAVEAELLGGVSPTEQNGVDHHATIQQAPAAGDEPSNVDRVLAVLDEKDFKTAQQIVDESGLADRQVRAALHSAPLKRQVISERIKKRVRFKKKPLGETGSIRATTNGRRRGSAAFHILDILTTKPSGLSGAAITDHVLTKIESKGKNPRNSVFSALHNLKTDGGIDYDPDTKIYTISR